MKILIIKEEGIGNAIMAIPMIRVLRDEYHDAKIDILASDRNYELCKMIEEVNQVYVFGKDEIKGQYDIGINTVFNMRVFLKKVADKCKKIIDVEVDFTKDSEAEANLRALAPLKLSDRYSWAYLPIEKAKSDFICIHTGCFDHPAWRNRKWPVEKWIELIKRLPIKTHLIGMLGEAQDAYKICEATGASNLVNLLPLKQTAELLAGAKALITIDSGMMHLAAAVKTYVIALFGPTSEIKSRPYVPEDMYSILRIPMDCQRCYVNDKGGKFVTCQTGECMKSITVDMVLEKLERIL